MVRLLFILVFILNMVGCSLFRPATSTSPTIIETMPAMPGSESYLRRAEEMVNKGDLDGAEKELYHARVQVADCCAVRLALAGLLFKKGRFSEAIPEYQVILEKYPNALKVRVSLGNALLNSGELPEAETHLIKAESLSPNNPQVLSP